ncbi:retrovirus-related Pol polyprotein from transposon 17.6, partial [Nephila pilipes]
SKKKESEPARPLNSEEQIYFVVQQKGLHLRDITLGDKTISALMDTGSSVSLIREDVSSFEHNFIINEDHYSLTWHVVSTEHLNFEAVIGANILKQASLYFTQNGVEVNKHVEKAWLMQILELHLENELDLSHILDLQIKNNLTRIIFSYKPEKTESTNVSMRIILEDDISAYQPALI